MSDAGFTFSAGDAVVIELTPVDGILGRYAGTAVTVTEGVALTSDLVLQVVTDELLVGTYEGVAEVDGTTCNVSRSLEMTFGG